MPIAVFFSGQSLPTRCTRLAAAANDLAVLYKEQAHYEKAKPLLLKAVEGRRLKLGDTHPYTQKSLKNLVELYEALGEPEKAEEWRTKLTQTEAVDE